MPDIKFSCFHTEITLLQMKCNKFWNYVCVTVVIVIIVVVVVIKSDMGLNESQNNAHELYIKSRGWGDSVK